MLDCLSIVFQASHSHIPFFCSHGFIGRDELGGLDECVSLLIINVALTLASGVASFSVGHAEKVISTDSTVGTRVAGNWDSNHLPSDWGIVTEENVHGGFFRLSSNFLFAFLFKLLSVGFWFSTVVATVEAADDTWWDGFLVTVFFTVDSDNLSCGRV